MFGETGRAADSRGRLPAQEIVVILRGEAGAAEPAAEGWCAMGLRGGAVGGGRVGRCFGHGSFF